MEELLLRRRREAEDGSLGQAHPLVRLTRFLRTLGHPAPRPFLPLAQALPRLYPKVRTRLQFERHAGDAGRPTPVWQPLAGNLGVSLVLDLSHQDLDLGPEYLEAWGVDFGRLLQQARANLVIRSGDARFHAVGQGCFRSTWQDDLDGSRILLPNFLRALPVKGDPVALLPRRDLLLVAGSGDPEGLVWGLGAMVQCLGQDAAALVATPLRYRHNRWEALDLPGEHPAADLLASLSACQLREERAGSHRAGHAA
jgi:hypothetical protein